MQSQMFTVWDCKTEAFMQPFFMQARGAALRSFADTCNDKDHAFNKHPADYTLFHLGSFDDGTGKLVLYDTPISLGVAQEFIEFDTPREVKT